LADENEEVWPTLNS